MQTKFDVTAEEIDTAWEFARKVKQSSRNYGRSDQIRDSQDYAADTFEGKLAEFAFQKFMQQNFALNPRVDAERYGPREIDGGNDMAQIVTASGEQLVPFKVDVKASRDRSQWLLVENDKIHWASAYVFVRLSGIPEGFEKNSFRLRKEIKAVTGDVCGFAYYFDFYDTATKKPWFEFKEGDELFDVSKMTEYLKSKLKRLGVSHGALSDALQAREAKNIRRLVTLTAKINYGIPAAWLRKTEEDWQHLLAAVLASAVPDASQIVPAALDRLLDKS